MKEELKKLFVQSLSGFFSLALAILFYFILLRYTGIKNTFHMIVRILTPFVYGSIMAYLLKTPCNTLEKLLGHFLPEKMKEKRGTAAIFIVLLVTGLVSYMLLSIVLPEIVSSITILVRVLPRRYREFSQWIEEVLAGNEEISAYVSSVLDPLVEELRSWTQSDLLPQLQSLMGDFAVTVSSILNVLYNLFIGLIVCIYILSSRKVLARQANAVIYAVFPVRISDWIERELHFIDKIFVGFFAGKILDSAIIGAICYIFCMILTVTMGFPNAMLISLIVGITNIIPYFGPYIGAVPSALLILIYSPKCCIIFLVFLILLQQFDGNYLGPRLLANSVGLPGLWVLFSITFFGGIFGFPGIVLGVPVFAVIYDLLGRLIIRGLKRHNRTDLILPQPSKDKMKKGKIEKELEKIKDRETITKRKE